jgi:hypothetical protein
MPGDSTIASPVVACMVADVKARASDTGPMEIRWKLFQIHDEVACFFITLPSTL